MHKLNVGKPRLYLYVAVNRTRRIGMYNIAVSKLRVQSPITNYYQRAATMQTITAPDYQSAVAYACKWFGLNEEDYL